MSFYHSKIPKQTTLLSPELRNELIDTMVAVIQESVATAVKNTDDQCLFYLRMKLK